MEKRDNANHQSINLEELAHHALRKELTVDQIMLFIDKVSDIQNFAGDLDTFYSYFIIKTIQPLYEDIPLIKLSLQAIESQIILSVLLSKQNCCEYIGDPVPPQAQLEKFFLEKFEHGFPPEENPGVKYPDEDEDEGDLHIPQVVGPDGITYNLHVMIDKNGKITRFCEPPIPVQNANNYDEIYAALVGKMLDFQKDDHNGE